MSDEAPRLTREERLAAQLRANLRRRKAQARALAGDAPAGEAHEGEAHGGDAPARPLSKPPGPG